MSQQLWQLLEIAEKRPLTEKEQTMLRDLLTNENERLSAAGYRHLLTHYEPTGSERQWQPDELDAKIAQVNVQLAKRSRRTTVRHYSQRVAWATVAVLVLLGFLLLRPFQNQPVVEPPFQAAATPTVTATPTPTPMPTPTLRPNYTYIDLLTAVSIVDEAYDAFYPLTMPEAKAQWPDALYLPTQTPQSWSLIGAQIDQENGIFELAFLQSALGSEVYWILSQAPANGRSPTETLPVTYQPLPRIDEVNTYADEETAVGQFSAHAYQYEPVYREGNQVEWVVYNSVTWQQGDQIFTLTIPDDNLGSLSLIATVADYLQIRLIED